MDVSDAEGVSQLFAANLASVRRLDLHSVFQPLIGNALVVDIYLKSDGISLFGVKVFQHGCDQNS